jgi:hypothetical protein
MSDILVFSPPAPASLPQAFENYNLGVVSGWLRDEGYDFDQKSLFVECRYLNRYRFRSDFVDLSVFEPGRVIDYLQGGEDEEISREANKLADMLSIDSYDTLILPLEGDQITSIRDPRLFIAFPILKERAQDKLVVIGGSDLTEDMEFARLSFVDYVVDGDVEIPLGNIFAHEFEGEDLKVEPGVMCERDGELLHGDTYMHPMDMKSKPYFERGILEKFAKTSAFDIPIIPYRLGRGCAQNCSFCTYFRDQKYQYKSVDKVVEELKELKEELGTKNVWFADQNIFNDPDYIKELSQRLKREDIEIKWASLGIIISRDQEFFDTLAEGGCTALYHGIESASNSVLHRMQKHQTRAMIESTLEKEYKAGIKPFAGFITDYVNETWEEYFETVEFVKQNPHLMDGEISTLSIYPSERQPLYRDPEEFGIEITGRQEKDWMALNYSYNLSFKDDRGQMGTAEERRLELKQRYLIRVAKIYLFAKNFGLRNPLTFLQMQLRKLWLKDYADLTHEYI